MKYKMAGLALISALSATPALAEQPSFSYVDFGYRDQEDFSGFDMHSSFSVAEHIYLTASHAYLKDSEDSTFDRDADLDVTLLDLGIGFKAAVGNSTSLYLEADAVRFNAKYTDDWGSDSSHENGHRLTFGARSMLNDSFELYGDISHFNLTQSSTEITVGLKGYFSNHVGLFAELYRNDFDADGYTLGLSIRF